MSSIVDLYHPSPVEEAYGIYLLEQEFGLVDGAPDFRVAGRSAVPFLSRSQLSREILRHIWSAVDPEGSGSLHVPAQFHVMLRLVALAQAGLVEPALHNAGFQSPTMILQQCLIEHGNRTDISLAVFDGNSTPDENFLRSLYYQKRVQIQNATNIPESMSHNLFDAAPSVQVNQIQFPPQLENNNQQQAGIGLLGDVAGATVQNPINSSVIAAQQSTHNFVSHNNVIASDTSNNTFQQQERIAISEQAAPSFGVGLATTSIEDAFGALIDVQDAPLPSLESEPHHPASTIGSTASSSYTSTHMTDLFAFGPSVVLESNTTAHHHHQRHTSESNPISTVNSTTSSMMSTPMTDLFETTTSGFGMTVSVAAGAFAPEPQPSSSLDDPFTSNNGTNSLFAADDLAINASDVRESFGIEKSAASAISDPFADVQLEGNHSLAMPHASGALVSDDEEDFGDFSAASAPVDFNQTPGVVATAPFVTSFDNQDMFNSFSIGEPNIHGSTEMANPPAHSETHDDEFGDFVGGANGNIDSFHATVTDYAASNVHDTIPQHTSLIEIGDDDDDFGDFEGGEDVKPSNGDFKVNEDDAFTPSGGDAFSAFDALVNVQDAPLPALRSLSYEKDDSLIDTAINSFPPYPPQFGGREDNDPGITEQLHGRSSVIGDLFGPEEAVEIVSSKSTLFAINRKEVAVNDENARGTSCEAQNAKASSPEFLVCSESDAEARMLDSEEDFCDFVSNGQLDTGDKKPVDIESHLSPQNDTFQKYESNDMTTSSAVGWGAFDALGSLENKPLPNLSSATAQSHEEKQGFGGIVDVFSTVQDPCDINCESHDNSDALKTEQTVVEKDESESFGEFVGGDIDQDIQQPHFISQENKNELQASLEKTFDMKKVDSTYYSAEVKSNGTDDSDEFVGFEDALESLDNCKPSSSSHSTVQKIKDTTIAQSEIEQSDPFQTKNECYDVCETPKTYTDSYAHQNGATANDFDEFGDFESHTLNNTFEHVTEIGFKDETGLDRKCSSDDLQTQGIRVGFSVVGPDSSREPPTELASFSMIETQQNSLPEGESTQIVKEMTSKMVDHMGDFESPSDQIGFGNVDEDDDFGDFEVATPAEQVAKSAENITENNIRGDNEIGDFATFPQDHDVLNAFNAFETTHNYEEDIDQIKAEMILAASQVPDAFWRKSISAKGVVQFCDCFTANVKVKSLNPDLRNQIERSSDLLHALSSTHYRLASSDWLRSLAVIQEELSRGVQILQEATGMMQWEIDYVRGTLEIYADGIAELIRLTRSITATIGDMLLLKQSALLTTSTVTSLWFDLDLVCKALEIENLWMQIEELKAKLHLNSKVSVESLVEIRSRGSDRTKDCCFFTLQPFSSSTIQSTKTAVSWKGNKYMACSANFLASLYASYAK